MSLNPTKQIDDVLDLTKQYHNLLQRSEDGTDTSKFIYDFGVLSMQNDDQTLHYLHDDLGSPVRLVDGIGSELDVFGFDEFGVPLHDNQNTNLSISFTGYQLDSIVGLLLSPSRAYSPESGRFVSEDTHWKPYNRVYGNFNQFVPNAEAIRQSGNLYDYAIGNPLKFIDLMGTEIVLTGTEAEQQIILNELNNLVGSTGNNPILSTTTNANGNVVVYFAQPPNPNFPQSTELVDRLINNEFQTTIQVRTGRGNAFGNLNDNMFQEGGNRGSGYGGTVFFNPESALTTVPTILTVCPNTGFVRPEVRPNFIGLGHELIHAERATRGALFPFEESADKTILTGTRRHWIFWRRNVYETRNMPLEEWATIGVGFNDECDITENNLRSEHGLNQRAAHWSW